MNQEQAQKEGEALSYALFGLTKLVRHWRNRKTTGAAPKLVNVGPWDPLRFDSRAFTGQGGRFFMPNSALDLASYMPPRLPEPEEQEQARKRDAIVRECVRALEEGAS